MSLRVHTHVRRIPILLVVLTVGLVAVFLSLAQAQTPTIADRFRLPSDLTGDPGWEFMQCNKEGVDERILTGDSRCIGGAVLHPGIDYNGAGGFSSDRGDPVYAVANGEVVDSRNVGAGYGNIIVIEHTLPDRTKVWSVYAHLEERLVQSGRVTIGQKIGTVGDSGGQRYAHLHFEIRTAEMETGFWPHNQETPNSLYYRYVHPEQFINNFNFYSQYGGVKLFTDSFFRGESVTLAGAHHPLEGTQFNNAVSSLAIQSGWQATVYDHNFSGATTTLYDTYANLANSGYQGVNYSASLNDTISSLIVMQRNDCGVTAAATNAPGTSCNPQPNPQPGDPGLPPSGGSDTTPPTISSYNVSISSASAYLGVSVSDGGGSGVKVVKYSAKVNGNWVGVANVTQSPFSFTWNLCDAGVPDGDIEFGVEAIDYAGNKYIWSQHQPNPHRTKSHNCSSGGGTNPTPDRSCTNLGEWDKKYAYFFDQENCLGNISWFSAHPEDGPGKSGQLSAYVPSGAVLKISSDNWNQGERSCLTGSIQRLSDIGWRNKIEWAQVIYGGSCQTAQPNRGVTFYSDKHFSGSSWRKDVGFEGAMKDNFQSIRLDDGNMSVVLTNEHGHTDCFDKYRFGDQNWQYNSMPDHGDWWHNTVWIRVNNYLCQPPAPSITSLNWEGVYKYGTNIVVEYKPYPGSQIIAGEINSTNGSKYFLNQPDSQTSWHLGVLEPGWYWGDIYALSDHGRGKPAHISFGIEEPNCNLNESGVIIFDGRHCTGDKVPIVEEGWYSLSNFNDRASSIFVQPGWSVEIYENTSADDGSILCANESKWDLSYDRYWIQDTTIDNTVTAVRVSNKPDCGRTIPLSGCEKVNFEGVALFDHTHCLGIDRVFSEPGFYNLYDFDDRASSVHVAPGWSVRAYSDNTAGGEFVCFTETKWHLGYDPYWHNQQKMTQNDVTSIEVFHDSMCGWPEQPIVFDPEHIIQDNHKFVLAWEDVKAGTYWVELWGPSGFFLSSGPLSEPRWELGPLPAGQYTWRVRGEVYLVHNDWSEDHHFTVEASGEQYPLQVAYTADDPNAPHFIKFQITYCPGDWVHVDFGDGASVDAQCINGIARTDHYYTYHGEAISYTAVVGGRAIQINIRAAWREPDCNEVSIAGIVLFAEKDCRGERKTFTSPGVYQLTDFNDITTAIYVGEGWSVEVREGRNTADGNVFCAASLTMWNLALDSYYANEGTKIDNTISSIRVFDVPGCGKELPQYGGCGQNILYDGAVLFDYRHCGGSELKFNKPGTYNLSDFTFDDLATSVHLGSGWSIKVYQDKDKGGLVSCFGEDMWELGLDKYWQTDVIVDNTISSVEVFHDGTCGWRPPEPQPLSVPQNLTPTNTLVALTETVTLQWSTPSVNAASASVTQYEVEFLSSPVSIKSATVLQPSLTLSSVVEGSYQWRVRAVPADDTARPSEWSTAQFVVLEDNLEDEGGEKPKHTIFLPVILR